MNKLQLLILITLLLLTNAVFGQSIDVETEKFPRVKKLTIKSFNGCCAKKGFKAIYYFDNSGLPIKSSNYFKRKLLASYEYNYNDKGLLSEKIKVYDINNKSRKDTTKFLYVLDEKDRVITKTKFFNEWKVVEIHSDFDSLNNAKELIRTFGNSKFIEKKQFNPKGQLILNQTIKNDSITWEEEIKYNDFGDKVYSYVPTLLDKETNKMITLFGGDRHWFLEKYEYTYNKFNRWTKKYVIFDNKKVLLEKRIYK